MDVWVLLSAITALTFRSALSDIFSCENRKPSNYCSCSKHSLKHYYLYCPRINSFEILAEIKLGESVQLQCSKFDTMNFTTLSNLHLGDVERFELKFCPLPNISIRDLIDKIGINKIKKLEIQSNNQFKGSLQKHHFAKLFDVTDLSLKKNGLTSLPGDLFEDMGNLTWLDMRYNSIELPSELFSFTPKLEVLELGENNLTYLIPGLFKNLIHLRLLNLWSNKLTNLTRSDFSDVPNLESLDLSTNQMESIRPDLFADLKKLKRLSLFGNKFVSLPQGLLSGNIYLEVFRMHGNNIINASLPPAFLSNLTMLKNVSLSNSKIMLLPKDTFSGSVGIDILNLNGNLLRALSKDTFASLKNLTSLDLSKNKIENLHGRLFYYTQSLKKLRLDFNNIDQVPEKLFLQLKDLEYLDLSSNKIKAFMPNQFSELSSLKRLFISHNQITNLAKSTVHDEYGPYSVMDGNKNLENLQLANNSLTEIYFDWTNLLSKLHTLNLSFNQFQELKTDDLNFTNEISIDLSNNNITWIDFSKADQFAGVNSFSSSYDRDSRTIKLDNNPFHCNCKILPFVQFIKNDLSPGVKYLYNIPSINLKCQEPKNLEHKLLSDVPFSQLVCGIENTSEYMCPEDCICQYRTIDKANLINCQNIGLKQIPSLLSTYKFANHSELYLEGNQLQNVNLPQDEGYKNVTYFNFANNNIISINISSISNKLKVLDVSNNDLSSITGGVDLFKKFKNLTSLKIFGNHWACNCINKDFIDSLKKNPNKIHLSNVNCSDGTSMDKLDVNTLCQVSASILIPLAVGVITGLVVAILTILYFRYQTEIRIYCFSSKLTFLRWLVSRPDVDEDKIYDAFISYAHEDEEFVTQHLVPYLEEKGETKFKLCLHYRDWTPGESIPLQILNSVKNSRRTIVVISPSFLDSVWGKMEFKTAHQQALQDGQTRVIPILYKDVGLINYLDEDLKVYFQMNTYVKWDSPWFWQQLNYALPHPLENAENISWICCCFQQNNQNTAPLIIEEVDLQPITLPSDIHQNEQLAVCA